MAAQHNNPGRELDAAQGPLEIDGGTSYDCGSQGFGDEPVHGARASGALKKKPAQSAVDSGRKRRELDALDELRLMN